MTSNIWGDYFGNEVEIRDRKLYNTYKKYSPDIIGFQEVTESWYRSEIMEKLAEEYTFVGTERFSVLNYTPLVYKTERFSIFEKGWKYYTQIDDKSKTITWAVLTDKENGKTFAVCNTHFWWMVGAEHDLIREQNRKELTALMFDLKSKYNCPVFAFGDLNCDGTSDVFKKFRENGVTDLFDEAEKRQDITSWHGDPVRGEDGKYHGEAEPDIPYIKSLDHIIGIGDYKVTNHAVVIDGDALDASDHSPVYADIEI